MSKDLIEEMRTAEAAAKMKNAEDFRQLCKDVANDKKVKSTYASEVLAAASKTADEFASEVERLKKRKADRALADTLPDLIKQRTAINKDFDANEASMTAARAKYEAAKDAISQRLSEVDSRIDRSEKARNDLMSTCQCPALLEREQELRRVVLKAKDDEQVKAMTALETFLYNDKVNSDF